MVDITFNKFKRYFDRLNSHSNEIGAIHIKKYGSDKTVAVVSIEMAEMYRRLEDLYWIERAEDALEINDPFITDDDNKVIILKSVTQYVEEIPEQYRRHIDETFKQIETDDVNLVVEELENPKRDKINYEYYKTLLFKYRIIYRKENGKYIICVIDIFDMKEICDKIVKKISLL